MGIIDGHTLFLEAFKDSVKKYSKKPAIYDEDSFFTYKELDRVTDIAAEKAMASGVERGDCILVYVPRQKEILVGAIGAFKAGGVYVPADFSYPVKRLNYMKNDSAAKCIFTVHSLWNEKPLEMDSEKVIFLDEISTTDTVAEETVFPKISRDDSAFVVYTSGSTGNPKGVLHDHGSLFYIANWHPVTERPVQKDDKYCHIAGFSFVAGMIDLFSPLLFGGSTVIFSDETRLNPTKLYSELLRRKVTCVNSSMAYVLMMENYDMSPFIVRLGGERVKQFNQLHKTSVIEIYGSSEGSMICSASLDGNEDPMPVGRPCEGVELMLIDDDLNPVPLGETGEIIYSGPNVAKKYLNRPDLNREKWIERDGKRWFKSGDLGRIGDNGMLYYVQRKDFMIKLRGFRIEPGEIEKQVEVQGEGKIKDSVCVLKKVAGEERLCCYFDATETVDTVRLRDKLIEVLPDYMIPERLIQVDVLPKNQNGKLDRNNLPQPPEDEEEMLTSLQIMRLAAEVYEKYGEKIDFTEMVKAGDRKSVMRLINQRIGAVQSRESKDIMRELETASLNFSQLGVYADCMANPDSVIYNIPVLSKMPEKVTKDILAEALKEIFRAHPYINVRFIKDKEGNTIQKLFQAEEENIETCLMTEDELKKYKKDIIKPFVLDGSEPLYRVKIIETEEALYLFADFHHLIFDGYSMYRFFVELNELFKGGSVKKETYTAMHYAAEQELFRNSKEFETIHNFWLNKLSLIEASSNVPSDVYDADGEVGKVGVVSETIDPEHLRNYARNEGLTLSSIYMAGLIYTISVYTGEDDIGLVTISNGRRNPAINDDFGMFVNTLPIISHISGGRTADFVKSVQNVFFDAIANENYPFHDIASEFEYRPNIMFAYHEGLFDDEKIADTGTTLENLEQGLAKFPLYFSVWSYGRKISIELHYDENRYTKKFIENMLNTYINILDQMCRCDTLEEISLCSAKQIEELDSFNSNKKQEEETETIVSMFKKTATSYPDKIALVFKDISISYSELDEITDKLAVYIHSKIHGKKSDNHEPVVSILVERSHYMIIAALGALKAGCAYQPLASDYPAERINYMISDAQPVLLIEDKKLDGIADVYEGEVLFTENIAEKTVGLDSKSSVEVKPDNLFIILYTSGSTGEPKGVMLEHKNLTAFCRWYRRYYDLQPQSKVAGYASFGFDACMMDMYPALTTGATLYIIPTEMRLNLEEINEYFNANGITHSFMTSQVGVQFHSTQDNSKLQHFSVGGEKLVSVKPKNNYILHNGYGPTECTIFSTIKPVLIEEQNIPIGRPVDSLRCLVVDKHMRRLPLGAVGELILMGQQVGRGYLNLPEQTEKAFFRMDGMRAYHTGDMVRYRANGDIEFVGRKDGQVKIRGFRVELKEVESVIRACDGIKDVTVQAFDALGGGKCLVAYIVCREGFKIEKLKSFILSQKPSYMVPSFIIKLDEIPLNINQKVDRKALPVPEFSGTDSYVAPKTKKERIVAKIVKQMMMLSDDVSMTDKFTALGGNSINAIRLTSILHNFGLDISSNAILKLNTIHLIAKAADYIGETEGISQESYTGVIDNTAIVQYFYDLKLLNPNHFNQAMFYKAETRIDMDILKKSLQILVEHHDMLRAVSRENKLFVRDVSEEKLFNLEESKESDVENKVAELEESLNIENGPLLKACVFHGSESDYLFVVIHHLVVDGISWRIFLEDLNNVYVGLSSKSEYILPDKTHGYADYAASLKKYRESIVLNSQRKYWDSVRNKMNSYATTERNDETKKSLKFERTYMRICSELSKTILTKCCEVYDAEINDLLIAALCISYHNLTGDTGLALRLEGHGREAFDSKLFIERTIGWFTSIYPVVIENLDSDIKTIIQESKKSLHEVPNKGFGYGQIYGIETEHMPLITFNYMGSMAETTSESMFTVTDDYSTGYMIAPENMYGTDINFNGVLTKGELNFLIDYNTCRFSSEQIRKLISGYEKALSEIAEYILSAYSIKKAASLAEQRSLQTEYQKKAKPSQSRMNENEKKIIRIIGEILDIEENAIDPKSDFFKLGGDQYACMELSKRLAEEYDVKLPLAKIYENSEILEIVEYVTQKSSAALSEDVYFYSKGNEKTPLIFVHTANAGSEVYYRLAEYLREDFAFSVIEQYNLNHFEKPIDDIPSLAAKYIEIVKRYQPEGPYNLGGWCFGGTVAFEMAHQLVKAGERVDKIILIDSQIVESDDLKRRLIESASSHARERFTTSPMFVEMRKKYLLEKLIDNSERSTRAWLSYNPPKYDGDVLYLKAELKAKGLSDAEDEMYNQVLDKRAEGYENVTVPDKLRVISVMKDHDTMLDEDALEVYVPAIKDFIFG